MALQFPATFQGIQRALNARVAALETAGAGEATLSEAIELCIVFDRDALNAAPCDLDRIAVALRAAGESPRASKDEARNLSALADLCAWNALKGRRLPTRRVA